MRRLAKPSLILIMCTLALATVCKVRAQGVGDNVKTFLDSEMPGIVIQANATGETRPTENLTIWLGLLPKTNVYVDVKLLRLDVYGFLNGTVKVLIGNITKYNFPLNGTSAEYNGTFPVPDGMWGVTFGEITLTYDAVLPLEITLPNNVTSGFCMTNVQNTFLENLEGSYTQLNDTYHNLTVAYTQLNENYTRLNETYTALQGSMNELDNTRRVAVILAITTVFFVATTIFMVMRRPKESW